MTSVQQHSDIIERHLNAFAAWPPILNNYSVGDYGIFANNVFSKLGNIKDDFGVDYSIIQGSNSSIDFTSQDARIMKFMGDSQVDIIPDDAVNARIEIEFTEEQSFLVSSPIISTMSLNDMSEVAKKLKATGRWDGKWKIVYQVYNAKDAAIFSTIAADTKLTFTGDAADLRLMRLGSPNVSIDSNRNLGLKIQGMDGVIAISLFRLKSKLFGGWKVDILAYEKEEKGIADISILMPGDLGSRNDIDNLNEPENLLQSENEELSPVLLGASAPSSVRPNQEFTARFVAYKKDLEVEMRDKLKNLSPTSNIHLGIKECIWQRGTKVQVTLNCKDLKIDLSEDQFIWNGTSHILDFDVSVPETDVYTTTVLKFNVSIDNIIVARIRIDLEITSELIEEKRKAVITQPIRTAFASYASEDRLRVLDRVAEIQRNGVDVFLDCMAINPGEEWKPRLEKEIKERETFLLFWSSYARLSKWVSWEWKTALAERGVKGIEPHPLEPPSQAPPPDELKALHFNDVYMMIRKANEDKTNLH